MIGYVTVGTTLLSWVEIRSAPVAKPSLRGALATKQSSLSLA
jgi:hypothetical protein